MVTPWGWFLLQPRSPAQLHGGKSWTRWTRKGLGVWAGQAVTFCSSLKGHCYQGLGKTWDLQLCANSLGTKATVTQAPLPPLPWGQRLQGHPVYLGDGVAPEQDILRRHAWEVLDAGLVEALQLVDHSVGVGHPQLVLRAGGTASAHHGIDLLLDLGWGQQGAGYLQCNLPRVSHWPPREGLEGQQPGLSPCRAQKLSPHPSLHQASSEHLPQASLGPSAWAGMEHREKYPDSPGLWESVSNSSHP